MIFYKKKSCFSIFTFLDRFFEFFPKADPEDWEEHDTPFLEP